MDSNKSIPPEALTGSLRDFRETGGADILGWVDPFFDRRYLRRRNEIWT